jgi:hypothetical protein
MFLGRLYFDRFYRRARLLGGIHLRLLGCYEPVAIRPTSPRTACAEEVRSGDALPGKDLRKGPHPKHSNRDRLVGNAKGSVTNG